MGKPITFAQDPIAVFLEYQLPQMIAQSREAEKNRVHELNVLEKQQELGQQNFLLETQVGQGIKQLDNLMADLQKQEDKMAETGLISDQFTILPAKDQSEGAPELTELVKTDQDHGFNMAMGEAENLNDYVANMNNKLKEGQQRQEVLNRIQAGMAEGERRAGLITKDLTGDEIITAADFNEYLILAGNPFDEGSPEYHGFISKAPGLDAGLDLAQKFKDLDYKDAQTANLNSETQANINELLGGTYGTGAIMNSEIFNDRMRLISDGYQALETNLSKTDFMKNTPYKMSSFNYTKDKNWYKDPFQMTQMVFNLERNIIKQLTHSEPSGFMAIFNPTDDKLDGLMKEYGSTDDAFLKRTAMDKIVARLGEIDLSKELDYNANSAQGIEYMKKQLLHYGQLRDAQNLLSQPEQVLQQLQPGGTEADPGGLGIGVEESTTEIEDDTVIPTPTLDDLNNEVALMTQDVPNITSPRLKGKADKVLKDISREQGQLGKGERLSALRNEMDIIDTEIDMLRNTGLISADAPPGLLMRDEVPTVPEGSMTGPELEANNRYLELKDRMWEITENILPFNTEHKVGGNSMGMIFDRDFNKLDNYIKSINRKSTNDLEDLMADLGGILGKEKDYKIFAEKYGLTKPDLLAQTGK